KSTRRHWATTAVGRTGNSPSDGSSKSVQGLAEDDNQPVPRFPTPPIDLQPELASLVCRSSARRDGPLQTSILLNRPRSAHQRQSCSSALPVRTKDAREVKSPRLMA